MLKLEKSRKDREIYIRIRQPIRLWDRYFLFALAIALATHLLAIILFHVHLFSQGEIETILPATKAYAHIVRGSVEEKDAIVSAQINMEGRLTADQLIPPEFTPILHLPSLSYLTYFIDYRTHHENNPFIEIEKDIEDSYFAQPDLPVTAPEIKISFAGPLAEVPLHDFNEETARLFTLQNFPAKNLHQVKAMFDVLVEASSGHIFWFQTEENSLGNVETERAEKLLRSLHFKSNPEEFVLSGQVEITFTSRKV